MRGGGLLGQGDVEGEGAPRRVGEDLRPPTRPRARKSFCALDTLVEGRRAVRRAPDGCQAIRHDSNRAHDCNTCELSTHASKTVAESV